MVRKVAENAHFITSLLTRRRKSWVFTGGLIMGRLHFFTGNALPLSIRPSRVNRRSDHGKNSARAIS